MIIEKLAFELEKNEFDLPEIYKEPLEKFKTYNEMIYNFPNIKLGEADNKTLQPIIALKSIVINFFLASYR